MYEFIGIVLAIIAILTVRFFVKRNNRKKEPELDLTKYQKNYSEIETEVIENINQLRYDNNLGALTYNNFVSYQCAGHVDYCIKEGKVSHDNFPMRASVIKNKLRAKVLGENVAYGYRDAEAIVRAWDRSEGHRKTLLGDYNGVGIAIKEHNTKMYIVLICIKL